MSSQLENRNGRGAGVVAAVLAAVVALAAATDTVVALVAESLGASSDFAPLSLPVHGAFTVVGVVVGWLGWRAVTRRAERPERVLAVLVPVVTVVSMAPDLLLLALRFIPGTSATAVVALMVMHLVVVAWAVPGYRLASRRLSPAAAPVPSAAATA